MLFAIVAQYECSKAYTALQSSLNFEVNKVREASYFYMKLLLIKNVEIMITKNDVSKVYDTVLSIPGMSELVKIDLKISRKNVLLLSHVISKGLDPNKDDAGLLSSVSEEGLMDLKNLSEECLQKAGLVELNQKLTTLSEACKV